MSAPTIIHSDYMAADTIMMSPDALRDRIFHNRVNRQVNRRTEAPAILVTNKTRRFLLDEEEITSDNVQICIQNDDKLITYLSAVKKKQEVDAVIFTAQAYVTILLKAHARHPVLVMRFPIDGLKVYSRSPGLFYMLPLTDIITKSTANFARDNMYALYYKKTYKEDTKQVISSIHYKASTGIASVPNVQETNSMFVDRMLHASSINGTSVSMRRNDEDNISKLDDMTVQMLIDIPTINGFKDIDKEQNIDFVIEPNEDGVLTMTMISKFSGGNIVEKPLVDENTALIWQFRSNATYSMYPRSTLLLQSVNNGIKLGSHFLYFAFCRYGDEYTFLKIVSSKAIKVPQATSGVLLGKLLEGASYVYEMYFCH